VWDLPLMRMMRAPCFGASRQGLSLVMCPDGVTAVLCGQPQRTLQCSDAGHGYTSLNLN